MYSPEEREEKRETDLSGNVYRCAVCTETCVAHEHILKLSLCVSLPLSLSLSRSFLLLLNFRARAHDESLPNRGRERWVASSSN